MIYPYFFGVIPMLKKGVFFTDIHFGRKSNSPIHNTDCLNFINWLSDYVRNDKTIDYIAFLGDWHENRTAIDISTLNYSYKGASQINDLGLPVFFCIGNHDMGMRHSREIYSTIPFHEFTNFTLIHDKPFVSKLHKDTALFVPYLLKDEYHTLNAFTDIPLWAGHFEFKDFVLTGYSVKLKEGPDISDFKDVGTILSGHFHKRQSKNNTQYVGNTFPMDFGDANDNARGFAVYDHDTRLVSYVDWEDCPKYVKCDLSDIIDGNVTLDDHCHLDINVNTIVNYEQLTELELELRTKFKVRSINLDESSKFIEENNSEIEKVDLENIATEDLIIRSLHETDPNKFDPDLLVELYRKA
jgi:DNA repair exonuclease SbcCD nuclease subunit